MPAEGWLCSLQAQDNILFTGKIEEYEAAFRLVDTEGKGADCLLNSALILLMFFCNSRTAPTSCCVSHNKFMPLKCCISLAK